MRMRTDDSLLLAAALICASGEVRAMLVSHAAQEARKKKGMEMSASVRKHCGDSEVMGCWNKLNHLYCKVL